MIDTLLTFEHSIKVNDASNNQLTYLQLWNGLLEKVLNPKVFNTSIQSANVEEIAENQYQRVLRYPNVVFEDLVYILPMTIIEIDSVPNFRPMFKSKMTVENSAEGTLTVHFDYQRQLLNTEEKQMAEYFKQVYKQMDYDTVEQIRQLGQ
jgi:hypothetical protein